MADEVSGIIIDPEPPHYPQSANQLHGLGSITTRAGRRGLSSRSAALD